MGIIYKITNKITNKVYIGQTKKTLEKRWHQHIKEAQDAINGDRQNFPLFHRMIIKYGKENFNIELLEECSDDKLDIKERYWINQFNSYNDGYNATIGGQDVFKERKSQGQKVLKYSLDGEFLCSYSTAQEAADSVKVHSSNIRKNCNGLSKSCAGFKWRWAKEEEEPIYPINSNGTKNRKVVQYDLNGQFISEYENISEAAKSVGISRTGIYNCCNNRQKTSAGFLWSYKI